MSPMMPAPSLPPVASPAAVQRMLHDLSQPLTTISLALTLASLPVDAAERELALQTAQEQCSRAIRGVHELRSLFDGMLAEASGGARGDSGRGDTAGRPPFKRGSGANA